MALGPHVKGSIGYRDTGPQTRFALETQKRAVIHQPQRKQEIEKSYTT